MQLLVEVLGAVAFTAGQALPACGLLWALMPRVGGGKKGWRLFGVLVGTWMTSSLLLAGVMPAELLRQYDYFQVLIGPALCALIAGRRYQKRSLNSSGMAL